MKESHRKGVATHPGPESCIAAREDRGEALTGVHAGQVLSHETQITPGCRRRQRRRKAIPPMPLTRGTGGPRVVVDPEHARIRLAGSWEILRSPTARGAVGRTRKSKDARS